MTIYQGFQIFCPIIAIHNVCHSEVLIVGFNNMTQNEEKESVAVRT